jgi:hypothetical protein
MNRLFKEGIIMKNKKYTSALVMALAIALVPSCVRETLAPVDENVNSSITINASIADLSTKVGFTPSYTGGKPQSMTLTWADGDKLRIYNHANRSQYSDFSLSSETIGLQAGKFTGTLVPAASYDVEVINGDFSYAAQTQPSDGVTTDLKYQASATDLSDLNNIVFTDFSSVLAVTVKMPSSAIAAKVASVDITASSNIFNGGNTLSITFSALGDADDDGILHFFATLPQGDQAITKGTTLLVHLNAPGEAQDVYTRFLEFPAAKTFTQNKLNTINISAVNSVSFANTSTTEIGTESNPYLIGDKYQMMSMGSLMVAGTTKYFKMVDDVDLDGVAWVPLNNTSNPPKSINFDGNGHTIDHLTVGSANDYPSFVGYLSGNVRNVVFDHASITTGTTKVQSGGVLASYMGGNGYQADCSGVTIRNSSVVSGGGSAYVGGLAARVGKASEVRNCHVINTNVTTSSGCAAGLLAYIASNHELTISACSAENITVTGGSSHYAAGLVAQIVSNNPVTICQSHTTGEIKKGGSGRHFGGLVGSVQSANVTISNCYSTCSVTGYQFNGGLVGSWWESTNFTGGSGRVDHCFASGTITDDGNAGNAGLVGALGVPGVTITNSIAWNSTVKAKVYGDGNYSSGAVVGRTHPNSRLENNYRKPGMSITAYWIPSASFDHPNSSKTGDVYYIWKIGADRVEANGGYTSETAFSTPNGLWAYHGKHLPASTIVTPDDKLGWVSNETISGIPDPEPEMAEATGYTGNNTWNLGTTVNIVDGVQWTHYHGPWEGQIREINIITTTINEHNKLKVYYNYEDEGKKYLNEKCELMDAVAGTNGSMTSQYIRVNDMQKRPGNDADQVWQHNCALTIDGDLIDIVKVDDNAAASMLPNHTVSCAGPLLVWKGNKLSASAEWLAADTDRWLTDGNNAGGQPRTAIGINKEGTKVIQVTVDGRWTSGTDAKKAYGMSTDLLAQLMVELGCYKAMNLDGGGGSQMWVYGQGDVHNIVNHPHNSWPVYGTTPAYYYWEKDGEVGRRTCCCAVYVYSDLK